MRRVIDRTFSWQTARLYLRVFNLVWDSSPSLTILSVLMVLVAGGAPPVQVWVSKLIIDQISSVASDSPINWQPILLLILLFALIFTISQGSSLISSSVHELMATRVRYYSLRMVIRKAASFDLAFFETPAYLDQMTHAKNEVWRLENIVIQMTTGLSQFVIVIALLFLLGRIGWYLPIILLLTILPRIIAAGRFTRQYTALRVQQLPAQRMIAYLAHLLGEKTAMKEIRLFGLEAHLLEHHQRLVQQALAQLTGLFIKSEAWLTSLSILSILGTAGIWVWAGLQALARQVSLGDVALIFQAVESSRTALDGVAVNSARTLENALYLRELFCYLDLQPEAVQGSLHRPQDHPIIRNGTQTCPSIEFEHVTFCYPGSTIPVLCDVSFKVGQGETIALVGENGAGKTTLVKLLARLYDPTEGEIRVDGTDLRSIDLENHYRQVGVVFQDFAHYDLTARENIAFGQIERLNELDQIRHAARMGGALELIEGLPFGFDTILGTRFQGGVDLSGGEWQKIALGRAFMREAGLLILDEPTAALDAKTENEVYTRFAQLTHGKTTLFVTHRLASVRMAHKILVLKDGCLVEVGNHAELMARGGEYASMYTLQARRYSLT